MVFYESLIRKNVLYFIVQGYAASRILYCEFCHIMLIIRPDYDLQPGNWGVAKW